MQPVRARHQAHGTCTASPVPRCGRRHSKVWRQRMAIKLRTFYMNGCPALDLHFMSYQTHAPNDQCYQFHQSAIAAIRNLHPDLLITTSYSTQMLADGSQPTAAQWQQGWASTFRELTQPATRFAMLGDIPDMGEGRCPLPRGPCQCSPGVQRTDHRDSHFRKSRCRASRRVRSWSAVRPHFAVGVHRSLRARHRRYTGVQQPISLQQGICSAI